MSQAVFDYAVKYNYYFRVLSSLWPHNLPQHPHHKTLRDKNLCVIFL